MREREKESSVLIRVERERSISVYPFTEILSVAVAFSFHAIKSALLQTLTADTDCNLSSVSLDRLVPFHSINLFCFTQLTRSASLD